MARHGGIDPEKSLATRAAWLHYAGGLTQAAVAKRLGVTGVKAHRLVQGKNRKVSHVCFPSPVSPHVRAPSARRR